MGIEDSKQDKNSPQDSEKHQKKDPISSKKKFTYRDMFIPQRLRILNTLLEHDEILISHLCIEARVNHPLIFKHIQYFKDIGILIEKTRNGLKYYSLRKNNPITKSFAKLKKAIEE
jgi:hypothetical protein